MALRARREFLTQALLDMTKSISDVIEARANDGQLTCTCFRTAGAQRAQRSVSVWMGSQQAKVESRWTKSGAQVLRGNGKDASAARESETKQQLTTE